MADLVPANPAEKLPVRFGQIPATIDEAWRIATIFAKSRIVPEAMRERPEDVFVAMQLGAEVGLSPTNAVQTIAVINGRAGIFGDGFLAVIIVSPHYVAHEEYYVAHGARVDTLTDEDLKDPTTAAVCTMWRRDVEQPLTRKFSIGDARRAGLLKKSGPWQEYPQRMLMYRARGFAGRDLFPDVLKGIVPGEEVIDAPRPAAPMVRRISDTAPVAVNVVTLAPATIVEARECAIRLDGGIVVDLDDDALVALDPYVGTATRFEFTVERRPGDRWHARTWREVEAAAVVDEGAAHA